MRGLEVLLLLLLFAALVAWCLPRRRVPRSLPAALALGAIAVALLHVGVEGARWQLVPAYAVAALAALVALFGLRRSASEANSGPGWALRTGQIAISLVAIAGVGLSTLLAVGFPVFELPEPTGPYAVGRTSLHIVDPSRRELYGPDPDAAREFMVYAWYPADPEPGAEPASYGGSDGALAECTARLTSEVLGLAGSAFVYGHHALVPTHSFSEAPIEESAGLLPVLVFSHGYALARAQSYTALMEELASHGYAIFAIDHTYETTGVSFPDGRTVCGNLEQIRSLTDPDEENVAFFEHWGGELSDEERAELVRDFVERNEVARAGAELWAEDTAALIDELERRVAQGSDPLAAQIDLERLGVFGMSFGGATAGVFCRDDARCRAGLNIDGFQYGGFRERELEVPFLLMSAVREQPNLNRWVYTSGAAPFYSIDVDGATHMNFADASIIYPIFRRTGMLGPIDGERMLEIMNRYTLAFFDEHLRGHSEPLLAASSPDYPEVALNVGSRRALPAVAAPARATPSSTSD